MPSEAPDPVVWILSTGTEILQGHYPDTNAQWISRELHAMGLRARRHMALPDDHAALREGLELASRSADLVIMTGGLGPTADDLNRETVAEVFRAPLREDAEALRQIHEMFASRGRPCPPSNAVQALIPEGATTLYNRWGTAPGFLLPARGDGADGVRAALLALPGPPREMNPMFKELAAPLLRARFAGGRPHLRTLTIHTAGLPESLINERIADLFGADPKVNVALLAGKWRVDVRLTLAGDSPEENAELADLWRATIADRLGAENLWGEDDREFEEAIESLLRERGQTLATAESCTGGLIAKRLTDVAGSSDVFVEGFVTYSNDAKIARLGVPPEVLDAHGAVSGETAEAMAAGARAASGASWALSVTGIAGPGGGSPEKPVGLVWFGLAGPDGRVRSKKMMGPRGRSAVRELAAVTALDWLRRAILRTERD